MQLAVLITDMGYYCFITKSATKTNNSYLVLNILGRVELMRI